MLPEQMELFCRAQACNLLVQARKEVMSAWQHEVEAGARKPPSAEGFDTLTRIIKIIYKKGER